MPIKSGQTTPSSPVVQNCLITKPIKKFECKERKIKKKKKSKKIQVKIMANYPVAKIWLVAWTSLQPYTLRYASVILCQQQW